MDPEAERHEILALGRPLLRALEALKSEGNAQWDPAMVELVTALRRRSIDCAEWWNCDEDIDEIPVAVLSGHEMIAMRAAGHGVKDSPVEKLIDAMTHAATALRDLMMGWPDKEIAAPSGALGRDILIADLERLCSEPFMKGIEQDEV